MPLPALVLALGLAAEEPVAVAVPAPAAVVPSAALVTAAFPVDGPGLLPAVKDGLDTHLAGALVAAGFTVQPAEKTQRFVKDAVDAGLSCSLTDDDCAVKAAIAAGADRVVIGRAISVSDRLVVELRLVSVDGTGGSAAAGVGDVDAPEGSLARIARRLVNPAEAGAATPLPLPLVLEPKDAVVAVDGAVVVVDKGVVWLDPGTHTVAVSREGYEARSVAVVVKGDRLPAAINVALDKGFPLLVGVGIGVGVGGGVLALASAVGVVVVESALAGPLAPAERASMTGFGQVLVASAVVGVAAVGAGVAVALVGGAE